MSKELINLKDKLQEYKFEFDLLQKVPCTEQENKEYQELLADCKELPKGVYARNYVNNGAPEMQFEKICESDLSESEIKEYLAFKQLSFIRTIKNCVLFFTILTIIGIAAYLFIFLQTI